MMEKKKKRKIGRSETIISNFEHEFVSLSPLRNSILQIFLYIRTCRAGFRHEYCSTLPKSRQRNEIMARRYVSIEESQRTDDCNNPTDRSDSSILFFSPITPPRESFQPRIQNISMNLKFDHVRRSSACTGRYRASRRSSNTIGCNGCIFMGEGENTSKSSSPINERSDVTQGR